MVFWRVPGIGPIVAERGGGSMRERDCDRLGGSCPGDMLGPGGARCPPGPPGAMKMDEPRIGCNTFGGGGASPLAAEARYGGGRDIAAATSTSLLVCDG